MVTLTECAEAQLRDERTLLVCSQLEGVPGEGIACQIHRDRGRQHHLGIRKHCTGRKFQTGGQSLGVGIGQGGGDAWGKGCRHRQGKQGEIGDCVWRKVNFPLSWGECIAAVGRCDGVAALFQVLER